ncbi:MULTISPECIES: hypothetical protein [Streptomyces]|uniref:Uncharacterized protein n=1 Tax=[Kitasatospora] papulosa TaxID=1464011 RepID=A0ABZ1K4R3_9ACTN
MNTNDQPTEPTDEPAVARYRRSDPGKEPTTPAGQAAAVEGMSAAGGYVPAANPETAVGRFQAQLLDIHHQYEQARRAEIIAAGGDPDEDRDPLEHVRWVADEYDQRRDDPAQLTAFLARLADELTLEDVRALRVAGEAAVAATSRVIGAEKDRGMKADRIAEEVGLTVSRVYQILREQRPDGDK